MVSYPAISAFFRRYLGKEQEKKRVLVLGLDAAGKTTILYRLALGEVVTTIPTIGFNVESVKIPLSTGRTVSVDAWDVGGCDKIRPLWRYYMADTCGVLFMIDANDRDRMVEAMEEFRRQRREFDIPELGGTAPPMLVFANKQDLPNAMTAEEVRQNIMQHNPNAPETIAVFPLSATGQKRDFQRDIDAAFTWFDNAIQNGAAAQQPPALTNAEQQPEQSRPKGPASDPRSPEALAERLESWIQRAQNEGSPEEFLEHFYNYNLPSWDHYTHVRLAYIILNKHGRQKGKNMIFDGIEAYIKNSTQTTGRTFHLTMTYFWIQMVNYAIASMHVLSGEQVVDGFTALLIFNPHLCDGMLWSDYYEKSTIMTPGARENMVLPDKKPLPNIIQREAPVKKT